MKTLTIKLSGPLQSYGNESTFLRRTSSLYPSKSAITGMVAAALGYHRDDSRISELSQLRFAVRIDQPGTFLQDYQTVEWKPGTRKVTYRDYIQDAVFVAAIGSDDESLIDKICYALKHPQFQLYLGRRSNVPAGVLEIETFANTNPVQVLEKMPWSASTWFQRRLQNGQDFHAKIIADAELLPDETSQMVRDSAVSFDQLHREHSYRAVAKKFVWLNRDDSETLQSQTKHDVMRFWS